MSEKSQRILRSNKSGEKTSMAEKSDMAKFQGENASFLDKTAQLSLDNQVDQTLVKETCDKRDYRSLKSPNKGHGNFKGTEHHDELDTRVS